MCGVCSQGAGYERRRYGGQSKCRSLGSPPLPNSHCGQVKRAMPRTEQHTVSGDAISCLCSVQRWKDIAMHTVRIYRLIHLSPTLFRLFKAAQMESAQVWNYCCELHKAARVAHTTWPGQNDLQQPTT